MARDRARRRRERQPDTTTSGRNRPPAGRPDSANRIKLPLYREAQSDIRDNYPAGANAGLWYDKFCNTWQITIRTDSNGRRSSQWSLGATDGSNLKLNWMNTLTSGRIGDTALIDELKKRLLKLVQAKGGRFWVFKTTGRFVTGMGRTHPVENGLAFHHTLGLPYLPGSSLKGLLRAYAEEQAALKAGEDQKNLREKIQGLFGNEETKTAGVLCFLDVLPCGKVQLEADVMTPHYANWTPADPPGDWRSPTPIPFLTVASDTQFLVAIVPRKGNAEGSAASGISNDDWTLIEAWLKGAMSELGAGAKTAVGYGRMRLDETETNKLRQQLTEERRRQEEEARLANLAPFERQLEELKQQATHQGMKPHVLWLKKLKEGTWSDPEDQRRVALKIKQAMEAEGTWAERSSKKNPQKDKNYVRTQLVLKYLQAG